MIKKTKKWEKNGKKVTKSVSVMNGDVDKKISKKDANEKLISLLLDQIDLLRMAAKAANLELPEFETPPIRTKIYSKQIKKIGFIELDKSNQKLQRRIVDIEELAKSGVNSAKVSNWNVAPHRTANSFLGARNRPVSQPPLDLRESRSEHFGKGDKPKLANDTLTPSEEDLRIKRFSLSITQSNLQGVPGTQREGRPRKGSDPTSRKGSIRGIASLFKTKPGQDTHMAFGRPLDQLLAYEKEIGGNGLLPLSIQLLGNYINSPRVLKTEGIFRQSGRVAMIQKLQEAFDVGCIPNVFSLENTHVIPYQIFLDSVSSLLDCHDVAGVFKAFIRQLPSPPFPFELYPQLMEISGSDIQEISIDSVQAILALIPKESLVFLSFVVMILGKTATYAKANLMDEYNLAVVFGPTIIRPQHENPEELMADSSKVTNLFSFLLIHREKLFRIREFPVLKIPPDLDIIEIIQNELSIPELAILDQAKKQEVIQLLELFSE